MDVGTLQDCDTEQAKVIGVLKAVMGEVQGLALLYHKGTLRDRDAQQACMARVEELLSDAATGLGPSPKGTQGPPGQQLLLELLQSEGARLSIQPALPGPQVISLPVVSSPWSNL